MEMARSAGDFDSDVLQELSQKSCLVDFSSLKELARYLKVCLKLGVVDIFYEIVNFKIVFYVLWFLLLRVGWIFFKIPELVFEPKVLSFDHSS